MHSARSVPMGHDVRGTLLECTTAHRHAANSHTKQPDTLEKLPSGSIHCLPAFLYVADAVSGA